jgi:hypothetical protein
LLLLLLLFLISCKVRFLLMNYLYWPGHFVHVECKMLVLF